MTAYYPRAIELGGGVDSSSDPFKVRSPMLLDAINVDFTATPGYKRRQGYDRMRTAVLSGGAVSDAAGLAVRENELMIFDDDKAYSYNEAGKNWLDQGRFVGMKLTENPIAHTVNNQTVPAMVTHNGTTVISWEDSSDDLVHYSVMEEATGVFHSHDTIIANATRPRICVAGNVILLFYVKTGSTTIAVKLIASGNPTISLGADQDIVSDMGYDYFDVVQAPAGDAALLAYVDAAGNLDALYVMGDGQVADGTGDYAAQTAISTGVTGTVLGISVDTTSTHIWATANYAAAGAQTLYVYRALVDFTSSSSATEVPITDTTVTIVADEDQTDQAYVFSTFKAGNPYDDRLNIRATTSSTISAAVAYRHEGIASKPIWYNGHALAITYHESTLQSVYFIRDEAGMIHGAFSKATGQGRIARDGFPPQLLAVDGSSSMFSFPAVYRERLDTDEDADDDDPAELFSQLGIRRAVLDLTSKERYKSAEFGGTLYVAGAQLTMWDGANLVEQGFHLYPETDQMSIVTGTGGGLSQGSYSYLIHYEWTNARGERVRSWAVVYSPTALSGSNDEYTITIPTLAATNKTDVSIVLYRTKVNSNPDDGAFFHRVSSPDPTATGANGYLANDPTADSVTFNDEMSDDSLKDNEVSYLSRGRLGNIAPTSAHILIEGANCVWLAGHGSGNEVIKSKRYEPGVPLEFSADILRFPVPPDGGKITALALNGNTLLVFKRDRIYAQSIQATPNNSGQGGFSEPYLLPIDTGAINQNGVVRTPVGVFFVSDKGIRLIDGANRLQPVGQPVIRWTEGAEITSAILVPDSNQVRFVPASGRAVVFDTRVLQWSTYTNVYGIASTVYKRKHVFLRADGEPMRQGTSYRDHGTAYRMELALAWIMEADDPNRMFLIRRAHSLMSGAFSDHKLFGVWSFDFGRIVYQPIEFDPDGVINTNKFGDGVFGDGIFGGSGDGNYHLTLEPPERKVHGAQLTIYDEPSSSHDQGYELSAFSVEMQSFGAAKLPATHRM